MRPPQIGYFIFRDLCNPRVGAEVVAGVAILAVATAISALSVAFSRTATDLVEAMMEPVRGVASTVWVTPEKGRSYRRFDAEEYKRLIGRIKELENDGKNLIEARSEIVTDIPNGVRQSIHFLNRSGNKQGMEGIRVWSAPYNSSFLREAWGMRYADGREFSEPGSNPDPDCLAGSESDAAKTPSRNQADGDDGFRARLGVIVNSRYLTKSHGYGEANLDEFVQDAAKLPRHIQFEADLDQDYVNTEDNKTSIDLTLCVTGIVHAPDYDFDLIFTEDLARSYYLVEKGEFHGRYAARFDQWESGKPLVLLDTHDRKPDYLWPMNKEQFDYVPIHGNAKQPHNLLILGVTEWRTEGKRDDLRDRLLERLEVAALDGTQATELANWAMIAAIGGDTEGEGANARTHLSRVLNSRLGNYGVELVKPNVQVIDRPGGGSETRANTPQTWRIWDPDDEAEIDWFPRQNKARLYFVPKWWIEVPQETHVKTILRLEGLIGSYGTVMYWVVLAFAAGAAWLLSIGHALRKNRDIGVLLANGASRSAVFSIYVLQIAAMALAGWLVGLVAARAVAPLLEGHATHTLRKFIETPESQEIFHKLGLKYDSVLALDAFVFYEAFLWVVPAALLGALWPVFRAARADPLSGLSKGI